MIVMDTSVALEIAMGSSDGISFQSLMMEQEVCVAPSFFRVEMANAVRSQVSRGLIPARGAIDLYNRSLDLMDVFWPSEDLFPEALTEAIRLNHLVYDIVYLVLARRLGATLLSKDKRLNELCDECGVRRIDDVEF